MSHQLGLQTPISFHSDSSNKSSMTIQVSTNHTLKTRQTYVHHQQTTSIILLSNKLSDHQPSNHIATFYQTLIRDYFHSFVHSLANYL